MVTRCLPFRVTFRPNLFLIGSVGSKFCRNTHLIRRCIQFVPYLMYYEFKKPSSSRCNTCKTLVEIEVSLKPKPELIGIIE